MPAAPMILRSLPGIKRDGTRFDGDIYTDGQWVRFQRGLPRKVGGYRMVSKYLPEISRGFSAFPFNNTAYCHSGSGEALVRFTLDTVGNASIISDRTPSGFGGNANNRWTFDYIYDSSTSDNSIVAHCAPNGADQTNSTGSIYIGDLTATAALTSVTLPAGANASGGVVSLHPYLFYYGSSGVVGWSVAGDPTDLSSAGSGTARVWGQKIIKGLPLRAGSGSSPAGIFWAYDAVIRSSFTGGSTVFNFDVLATDTSIMSPDCVVDYDGVFYWAGVDRFMMFNGVVREVPNTFNSNWFFDGLNREQAQKVFAFKVPRYGEIWWCYPRGSAVECTHAVIYNVRENVWYDTELPNGGRAAGGFTNFFSAPLLMGVEPSGTGYRAWWHENGVDEVDGPVVNPIPSHFETADISLIAKGQDGELRLTSVEPDFIQVGDMTATVTGRANTRSRDRVGPSVVFPDVATTPNEQIVKFKEQRREMRVRFESNTVGGDYQMGQIIAYMEQGDKTSLGGSV